MRQRATGRRSALVVGALLGLLACRAHANGWSAVAEAMHLGFTGAVLLAPLVVVIEALSYRRLLGATWPRAWLSGLVANVAAIVPMAPAIFFLALVAWCVPYHQEDALKAGLLGLLCLVAAVGAKVGVVHLLNRETQTKRPVWQVSLGVTGATLALVLGVCAVMYSLSGV